MKRKRKVRTVWSMYHLRWRAYRAQGGLCYWCQQPMLPNAEINDPRALTADHLVPRYAGGQTKPGNIVAACRRCNSERNAEVNMPRRDERVLQAGDNTPSSPFARLKK
jgi:5-methylcytosine-specific restriction enzyme A